MNPLYQQFGMTGQRPMSQPMNIQTMNPMQKAQLMMQAMANPAAFVKQHFPDIPAQIQNDPNQVLSYIQQTRGISNATIQELLNQNPYPRY